VTVDPEAAIERVRPFCLDLPRAVEQGGVASGVGKLSGTRVVTFKVSRRVFARVFVLDGPDGREVVLLWLRAAADERRSLLESGHPFLPAGPREVMVTLNAETDWEEVGELVTESYLIMAPAKLAAEVAARS
jgi:hypothetical protein